MKLFGYLLALSVIQGVAWSPAHAEAQGLAHTRLTKAQAVQAAQVFCRSVGVPVQAPVGATYPAVDVVPELPSFWQPRWQVVFQNQVKVQVVDATGLVCDLSNYGLTDAIPAHTPAGDAIPKMKAVEKARSLMRACGYVSELGEPIADEEQWAAVPESGSHIWMVSFPRVYQGVPYEDQGANVLLQAETGEPAGFAVRFTSPTLDPAPVRVGLATAAASASSLMSQSLAAGAVLAQVKTEIVQPNTFWLPNGSEDEKVGKVRTARVVAYKAGTDTVEVWLDAETGDVIGGSYVGLLSANGNSSGLALTAKPRLPIKDALQAAQEVRIYGKNRDGGGWHFAPLLVLNRRTQTKTFEALRTAKPEAAVGISSDLEGDKVVTLGSNGLRSEYIAVSGYVGDAGQWVRIPANLQELLNKTRQITLNK